jgi:hypothetical protein
MIDIFNQEESASGKQENRKKIGIRMLCAFDLLAPAHSVCRPPVHVARIPAAPFCETPRRHVAAKFFPTSLAVPLFFLRSCFPNSNRWFPFS